MRNSRKIAVLLATIVVVAGVAIAAFAFFSAGGAGSGSAAVGTSTSFTITGSATGLYPGSGDVAVSYTVHNPGSGYQQVHSVTVSIPQDGTTHEVLDSTSGNPITGCLASWFGVGTATQTLDQEVAPSGDLTINGGSTPATTLTVHMTDVNSSQDNCKNASIKLGFSSN
jgi:hypothetical protein